jgi:hypothetical protein
MPTFQIMRLATSRATGRFCKCTLLWLTSCADIRRGGAVTGPPKALARAENILDIFIKGTKNQVVQKAWNGTAWHPAGQSLYDRKFPFVLVTQLRYLYRRLTHYSWRHHMLQDCVNQPSQLKSYTSSSEDSTCLGRSFAGHDPGKLVLRCRC